MHCRTAVSMACLSPISFAGGDDPSLNLMQAGGSSRRRITGVVCGRVDALDRLLHLDELVFFVMFGVDERDVWARLNVRNYIAPELVGFPVSARRALLASGAWSSSDSLVGFVVRREA